MLIDLHCHTTRSQDSRLVPEDAVAAARDAGLDAVCFTEHDVLWPVEEVRSLSRAAGFPVLAGVEVSTEIGHVLAYGLPEFDLGLRRFAALVERARDCGAALVLAHPYRRHFRFEVPAVVTAKDVTAALRRRGLSEVAALECGNGATRPIENTLAGEVALRLSLPTTAGSDAHAPERVGPWATEVRGAVGDEADLAAAIIAGRVRGVPMTRPETREPKGRASA
ncbi:MAG: PHP domain-containing protein [Pseudonocardia sp.]